MSHKDAPANDVYSIPFTIPLRIEIGEYVMTDVNFDQCSALS